MSTAFVFNKYIVIEQEIYGQVNIVYETINL